MELIVLKTLRSVFAELTEENRFKLTMILVYSFFALCLVIYLLGVTPYIISIGCLPGGMVFAYNLYKLGAKQKDLYGL